MGHSSQLVEKSSMRVTGKLKIFLVLSYVLILIQFIVAMSLGLVLYNTRVRITELEQDNKKIRQELKEAEDKCARMTDACIYILSEGVW